MATVERKSGLWVPVLALALMACDAQQFLGSICEGGGSECDAGTADAGGRDDDGQIDANVAEDAGMFQPDDAGLSCNVDVDRDGYVDEARVPSCASFVRDEWLGTDCDDDDAYANPNGAEECDGRDQDCDLAIDEGLDCTRAVTPGADQLWPGYDAIASDAAGNLYLVGSVNGKLGPNTVGGETLEGDASLLLVSYTPSGALRWRKSFPCGDLEYTAFARLAVHDASVYLLLSASSCALETAVGSTTTLDHQAAVLRLNASDGDVEWIEKLALPSNDVGNDDALHIESDASGRLTLAVTTATLPASGGAFTPIRYGIFYARLDQDGSLLWSHGMAPDESASSFVTSLSVAPDGHFYLAGRSEKPLSLGACAIPASVFVASFAIDGSCRWFRATDVPSNPHALGIEFQGLGALPAGGVVVSGKADDSFSIAGLALEIDEWPADETRLVNADAFVFTLDADGEAGFKYHRRTALTPDGQSGALVVADDGRIYVGMEWFRGEAAYQPTDRSLVGASLAMLLAFESDGRLLFARDLLPEHRFLRRWSTFDDLTLTPQGIVTVVAGMIVTVDDGL